jgi:hypothetical protein
VRAPKIILRYPPSLKIVITISINRDHDFLRLISRFTSSYLFACIRIAQILTIQHHWVVSGLTVCLASPGTIRALEKGNGEAIQPPRKTPKKEKDDGQNESCGSSEGE